MIVARRNKEVGQPPAPSPAARKTVWWNYAVAIVSVGIALGLTLLLGALMRTDLSLFFFLVVVVSSRYGGLGPGLLATVLGVVAEVYFLIPPSFTWVVHLQDVLRLIVFALAAVLVSTLNAARMRAEEAVSRDRDRIGDLNARLTRAMTEMHHRIKNNLQIVYSITEMRLPEGTDMVPAQELRELGMHIRTLAALHDMLTQKAKAEGEPEIISAKALLDKLLPLLQQSTGSHRFHIQVEDIPLTAKQGTSLTLLVNELVTNAVKHGHNEIGVCMRRRDHTVTLKVSDDGPGFPDGFDPKRAAHTGLDLIESLTRLDLQGQVRYQNREEGGADVILTFPVKC